MNKEDLRKFFSSDSYDDDSRWYRLLAFATRSNEGKTINIDQMTFKLMQIHAVDEYITQAVFEAHKKGESPVLFSVVGDADSWSDGPEYTSPSCISLVKPVAKKVTLFEVIK